MYRDNQINCIHLAIDMAEKKRILFIGLACVDISFLIDSYPIEDSDHCSNFCRWSVGGNAANSSQVFSHLLKWIENRENRNLQNHYQVEFIGSLGDDVAARWMEEVFTAKRITSRAIHNSGQTTATTTVLNSPINGTRTFIFYCNHLPEPNLEDLQRCDILNAHWIHFEGRYVNMESILETIRYIRSKDTERKITISFELEQPDKRLEAIFEEDIDYLFIGKQFAPHFGWNNIDEMLHRAADKIIGNCWLVCIWGLLGSKVAKVSKRKIIDKVHFAPAYLQSKVLDTCGAGDTFLAATIFDIIVNKSHPGKAINFGSRVAGAKVAIHGFKQLDEWDSIS
ncbi:ketohexokinase-like [Brevipalpus obovatus]|uniref:ketohexokinase-like n=1 Tax=Brevipalpus obovatus TaxID=246614 RepID=UPI003D9DC21C